jgi:anti-anti-sigma regulatory factor
VTVVELRGRIGPMEALELRGQIDSATAELRPQVVVDLSEAETIHPSVVAAIVRGVERARYARGSLRVIPPTRPAVIRVLDLVSARDLLR